MTRHIAAALLAVTFLTPGCTKDSMSAELGHFFPAGDTIRVQGNGTTYLTGKMALH